MRLKLYSGILALSLMALPTLVTGQVAPQQDLQPADRSPNLLRDVRIEQRLNEPLPLDAPFRDERGRAVTLRDYLGKRPAVLALVYYDCPMLCSQVLSGMTTSLKILQFTPGKDYEVVVASFNPRDTAEMAAAKKQMYVRQYGRPGAEANWHFLSGDQASIDALTRAVGFHYAYDPESGQYAHASAIMVVTPDGRLAQYYYGIEYSPRDLRMGLVEASQNRIGNVVDQVLLYCFHYDPTTGKYGAVAMNIIRLGGILTILILGAFIFISLRKERHPAQDGTS